MSTPNFEALTNLLGRLGKAAKSVTPMPGGASTRKYFRLDLGGDSAVAMFFPEGGAPEEIQKATPGRRWPFLEVQSLLAESGVDVPRIHAEDTHAGWIVLEDLGDDTLANWLLDNPNDKTALYETAVRDLAKAQARLGSRPGDSIVAARAFDADLLKWEIEHFREWGLEARGLSMSATDRERFDVIGTRLADRIAALPRGFVHRDYQSRNLMVRRNTRSLVWIDFQDALLGPRVYDLVALLNDSYQEFDRSFVEARLSDFAEAAKLDDASRSSLVTQFDLVTVQRKLKDAGRFVFIDRKKQNSGFLRFVEPTIEKVRSSLGRLAPSDVDMAELAGILDRALASAPVASTALASDPER
ncbi:MAG: phosphotransferase [Myxococcales bacterium]|nr:phosphotransferase [Myxococcales bacterium]